MARVDLPGKKLHRGDGEVVEGGDTSGPASALVATVRHMCLASPKQLASGQLPEDARLSDQARVGVLLQGAALLSHLRHAGCQLREGFSEARLGAGGRLLVAPDATGIAGQLPQTQLRVLIQRLFQSEREVAGRGQARRVVRKLQRAWDQDLIPQSPDQMVTHLLSQAPFLWRPSSSEIRRSLIAEHRRGGTWSVRVAGPGFFRRRVLGLAPTVVAASDLIAAPRIRDIWKGLDTPPVGELASGRRWQRAVNAYASRPPSKKAEKEPWARCLYGVGRFEEALEALRNVSGHRAGVLKVACQYQLGRLEAAHRGLLTLEQTDLSGAEVVELGDVALRVSANRGDEERVREWIRRLIRVTGKKRLLALVWAALGAWDLGDLSAMEAHLVSAEAAADHHPSAGPFHQARGLLAIRRGQAQRACEQLALAMGKSRRRLRRFEAGRLWNDLILARVSAGDLSGAERACRHAVRLLDACDGPLRSTLGLYNLAEVRIRRGRLSGTRKILERSSQENRLAGNVRGAAQDSELWARFELAQGRPAEALQRCYEGLDQLTAVGAEWNKGELELLAARSLGWLGRDQQARQLLDELNPLSATVFEPEEVPMMLAQAGLTARAIEAVEGSPVAELISSFLAFAEVGPRDWEQIEVLDEYRRARLVFDLSRLGPQRLPDSVKRRAATILRKVGNEPFAALLDAERRGVWHTLRDFLQDPSLQSVPAVFEASGAPDAVLGFRTEHGDERVIVGRGDGEIEALVPVDGGCWFLRSSSPNEVLDAFARVVALTLSPPPSNQLAASVSIVGESQALREAWNLLVQLGSRNIPVLILGETGTGKEMAAREVHRSSERRDGEFLAVNCAAMSDTLVLSDLFGHAQGSFTGADQDRAGIFESAQLGTVFLDEIGDLPLAAQGMLLRVLQDGEIRRVGESRVRHVDVRVVAATHRDLHKRVQSGAFREDLYYRLDVGRVRLPPLRERGADVLLLAQSFMNELDSSLRLSEAARERLLGYHWPGNVRQLRGALERAVAVLGSGSVVQAEHLDLPEAERARPPYHQWLDALKRQRLSEELALCDGNQSAAARRLGLSRQALSYLVRTLGLR